MCSSDLAANGFGLSNGSVRITSGTNRRLRLFAVTQQVMKDPDVAVRLKTGGAEVVPSESPAAFSRFVAAETQRWAEVAKESGATAD